MRRMALFFIFMQKSLLSGLTEDSWVLISDSAFSLWWYQISWKLLCPVGVKMKIMNYCYCYEYSFDFINSLTELQGPPLSSDHILRTSSLVESTFREWMPFLPLSAVWSWTNHKSLVFSSTVRDNDTSLVGLL